MENNDTNRILDRIVEIDAEISAYCAEKNSSFESLANDLRSELQDMRRKYQVQMDRELKSEKPETGMGQDAHVAKAKANFEARYDSVKKSLLADFIDTVQHQS